MRLFDTSLSWQTRCWFVLSACSENGVSQTAEGAHLRRLSTTARSRGLLRCVAGGSPFLCRNQCFVSILIVNVPSLSWQAIVSFCFNPKSCPRRSPNGGAFRTNAGVEARRRHDLAVCVDVTTKHHIQRLRHLLRIVRVSRLSCKWSQQPQQERHRASAVR